MIESMNLTRLIEMTENDQELLKELFKEFQKAGLHAITTLEQSCQTGDNEMWRREAHAFKGTTLNLGANTLAELCKTAQEHSGAEKDVKLELLSRIRAAFQEATDYLVAFETKAGW